MPESQHTKQRRDLVVLLLALLCSAVLAVVVGAGAFFWNELEQTQADNAALAAQVRSLGGQPVAEGKPGGQGPAGPQGSQGPRGLQGIQGPPGIQGKQGPIGITGRSPQCLLEPSRCVGPSGPTGAAGERGETGPQGPQGEPGATGEKGDQGPTGADGETGPQGEPGSVGPQGTQGRGISDTDCVGNGAESHWVITYTDGTTSTAQGPCRLAVIDPPAGN
jgi:hypothetical protein